MNKHKVTNEYLVRSNIKEGQNMTMNNKRLADILTEKGLGLNQKYGAPASSGDEITARETLPYKPSPRAKKLMDLY